MNGTTADIVWHATMDGRYLVQVVRKEPYAGALEIWDGDNRLLTEEVPLSSGAIFGPDISDVNEWQVKAMDFIDRRH